MFYPDLGKEWNPFSRKRRGFNWSLTLFSKGVMTKIHQGLPQYLGEVYEKVARERLALAQERIFPYAALGRWWDRNEEIDLVAINKELDSISLGEIKWTGKPVGTDIYENLKRKAQKVEWGSKKSKGILLPFQQTGIYGFHDQDNKKRSDLFV